MLSPTAHPRALISPRFSVQSLPQPINLEPSQLPFIAEVKARLESGAYKLESGRCPCGEEMGVVISEVDRYGLPLASVLCLVCGTIRIDSYLDKWSLEDFYERFYQQMYARAIDLQSYSVRQVSYGEKILAMAEDFLKPGSWVYEVGCGAGAALKVFHNKGYQVAGCEYSPELIAAGVRLGVPNICHGSLKDIQTKGGVKADLIYLHHVFEHVSDPLDLLKECRNHLKAGARIMIIVPDVSRIDSFAYPAGDLLQFLHIAHKYNFSFEGLRRVGGKTGYYVNRLTPDPGIQTPCSHMPELWVELVLHDITTASVVSAHTPPGNGHGRKLLSYLRRTEKLHSVGLCRGQLLPRITESRNSFVKNLVRLRRVTPAKVTRKLKRIT